MDDARAAVVLWDNIPSDSASASDSDSVSDSIFVSDSDSSSDSIFVPDSDSSSDSIFISDSTSDFIFVSASVPSAADSSTACVSFPFPFSASSPFCMLFSASKFSDAAALPNVSSDFSVTSIDVSSFSDASLHSFAVPPEISAAYALILDISMAPDNITANILFPINLIIHFPPCMFLPFLIVYPYG